MAHDDRFRVLFEPDDDDVRETSALVLQRPDGSFAVIPSPVLDAYTVEPDALGTVQALLADGGDDPGWTVAGLVNVGWIPPGNLPFHGGDPEPPACSNSGILVRPPIPVQGYPLAVGVNSPVPIPPPPPPPPLSPDDRGAGDASVAPRL